MFVCLFVFLFIVPGRDRRSLGAPKRSPIEIRLYLCVYVCAARGTRFGLQTERAVPVWVYRSFFLVSDAVLLAFVADVRCVLVLYRAVMASGPRYCKCCNVF